MRSPGGSSMSTELRIPPRLGVWPSTRAVAASIPMRLTRPRQHRSIACFLMCLHIQGLRRLCQGATLAGTSGAPYTAREPTVTEQSLEERAINTIRFLSVDAVQKANSGHPGLPMGAAAPAYVLWTRFMHHNPSDPSWPDRDRFVLSAGHGSMLLYSLLHLTGY